MNAIVALSKHPTKMSFLMFAYKNLGMLKLQGLKERKIRNMFEWIYLMLPLSVIYI